MLLSLASELSARLASHWHQGVCLDLGRRLHLLHLRRQSCQLCLVLLELLLWQGLF